MLGKIASVLKAVREKTPLVQSITNYVTINDCANILLCFGASPAMCEVREVTEIPDMGWYSVMVDPTGAAFGLFQPKAGM
jgi:hydroxyethylthiazole kinase-like sugar kinase family protein